MLYLILDEHGVPDHRWSIDPVKDFQGVKVIGEALKYDGSYADSAWLSVVNGTVIVDEGKVKACKQKAIDDDLLSKAQEQAMLDKRKRLQQAIADRSVSLNDIADYILMRGL